eukprot:7645300-Prorocentrum_lima.AAC.1
MRQRSCTRSLNTASTILPQRGEPNGNHPDKAWHNRQTRPTPTFNGKLKYGLRDKQRISHTRPHT